MSHITYPYLPEGRALEYVGWHDMFINIARILAEARSLDRVMPGAAVIVKDDRIIGFGTNGSDWHKKHGCERVRRKCPTGEGYELCEGCHPRNHSEARAIRYAREKHNDPRGADLYLWGHWWCCKPCWDAMIEAGINRVYLLHRSEELFNKDHPNNIIGKQFQFFRNG